MLPWGEYSCPWHDRPLPLPDCTTRPLDYPVHLPAPACGTWRTWAGPHFTEDLQNFPPQLLSRNWPFPQAPPSFGLPTCQPGAAVWALSVALQVSLLCCPAPSEKAAGEGLATPLCRTLWRLQEANLKHLQHPDRGTVKAAIPALGHPWRHSVQSAERALLILGRVHPACERSEGSTQGGGLHTPPPSPPAWIS